MKFKVIYWRDGEETYCYYQDETSAFEGVMLRTKHGYTIRLIERLDW